MHSGWRRFAVEITRAIRDCTAFVLLLSPASNSSDYVHKEVAIAHHFRKPVIPVLLAKTDLSDELLPYLVRHQYWELNKRGAGNLGAEIKARFSVGVGSNPFTLTGDRGRDTQEIATSSEKHSIQFVTNDEYLAFMRASGRRCPRDWNSSDKSYPSHQACNPVIGISWLDAVAYCDWTGGSLPTPAVGSSAERMSIVPESQQILEWRDSGTERHKQICDPRTSNVVAIMDLEARPLNVSFRSLPVASSTPSQWIHIDRGAWHVGTDVAAFARLAASYRLRPDLGRPILNRSARRYNLHEYAIADTCVSNEDYYAFTLATGKPWPSHWDARWLRSFERPFPLRIASHPVVNVSAEQAQAYCIWSRTRLPTWIEWQRAASGPAGHPYPWGPVYSAEHCNSVESERGATVPVHAYPVGDSMEKVRQLSGNVAEWVGGPQGVFELRGGSYRVPCELWGLAYVFRQAESAFHASDIGFRVVSN